MLDEELAVLWEVETKQLKRGVNRNIERFPGDFMFQLRREEFSNLRRQSGTSRWGSGYLPCAFTEQGVAMVSSVLRRPGAVQVNIRIMRTFVKLRQIISTDQELETLLDGLDRRYDKQFREVFEALPQLMEPPQPKRLRIGFRKWKRFECCSIPALPTPERGKSCRQ